MIRFMWAAAVAVVFAGFGAAPTAAQDDDAGLLRLNRALFETLMIERDPGFFLDHSAANYVVVGPGGVVESREQVVAGLGAFARLDSIAVSREAVRRTGDLAVVTSRLELHGAMDLPVGGTGGLTTATTFVLTDGRWVAVSRTLTPCNPRAEERGLC
ncbi:MAG: DUF4440 domain-containing protein [Longimicrobiales bacterium]